MPEYEHYETCPIRENNTLDQRYCKIKNAYKSRSQKLALINDHATVFFIHVCKQKLRYMKLV